MIFTKLKSVHHKQIVEISKELEEWFDELGQEYISVDINYQKGIVAIENEKVVGFMTYFFYEGSINIGWVGVKKDNQRKGIGKQLFKELLKIGKKQGIKEVRVYTVGESVDYEPYERTRQFYYDLGFICYQRAKTDNPNCPEEIKLKYLIS